MSDETATPMTPKKTRARKPTRFELRQDKGELEGETIIADLPNTPAGRAHVKEYKLTGKFKVVQITDEF